MTRFDSDQMAANMRALSTTGITAEELARRFAELRPVLRDLHQVLVAGLEHRITLERAALAATPWWRVFDQIDKRREIAEFEKLLAEESGTQS